MTPHLAKSEWELVSEGGECACVCGVYVCQLTQLTSACCAAQHSVSIASGLDSPVDQIKFYNSGGAFRARARGLYTGQTRKL
jgi:hypothetical protein